MNLPAPLSESAPESASAPIPRIHGGPDQHGVPLHDFSSNSNAVAPCAAALAALQQADASRYPDASYSDLRQKLAEFHGVDVWRVVLAASASEFIFRITALLAQQQFANSGERCSVWLPPHSYGDYAQAAQAHQLPQVADAGTAQLLWACEPASPLGSAQSGLSGMADHSAAHAGHAALVLDCAYAPLRLSGTPSLSAAQQQTVWQLWTPNKALGLTGIRAAYAIAPLDSEALVARLDQLCPSWPVGAHGVAMLQAWTGAKVQTWLAGSLDTLRDWKARQIALCESLGWICLSSDANFFCATPALPVLQEGLSLQHALKALRQHGIKLRDTTSFGLAGQVRLSVQSPASQDALLYAWQKIIKEIQ